MAQRVGDFTVGKAWVVAPKMLRDIIDFMFNDADDDLTVIARVVLKIQGYPLTETELKNVLTRQTQEHQEQHARDWDDFRAHNIKKFRDTVLKHYREEPEMHAPGRLLMVAMDVKLITNELFAEVPPPTVAEMMSNPACKDEWMAAAREHLINILHIGADMDLDFLRRTHAIFMESPENRAAEFRTLLREFQVGEGDAARVRARAKLQAMRESRRRGGQ
jgi:hypothetical protein